MTDKQTTDYSFTPVLSAIVIVTGVIFGVSRCGSEILENERLHNYTPINIRLKDVNKDGLQDIIYNSGEIYLQTRKGTFISYDSM
jgi:hypothetical protein